MPPAGGMGSIARTKETHSCATNETSRGGRCRGPAGEWAEHVNTPPGSLLLFQGQSSNTKAANKGRGPWRCAEGGEGVKEPSYVEEEQGDQRNAAAVPDSTLADAFSRDGRNQYLPSYKHF